MVAIYVENCNLGAWQSLDNHIGLGRRGCKKLAKIGVFKNCKFIAVVELATDADVAFKNQRYVRGGGGSRVGLAL